MSFFTVIKNAFGFGPDDECAYEPESGNEESSEAEATDDSAASEAPAMISAPTVDAEMKARIFDNAVAVFNSALPDFLSKSVNPAEQSRILLASIDKGLDDYLNTLVRQAEQYAEAKLRGATDSAMRESEKLRSDLLQIEQQRSALREQQLSADRRRRALADRVSDLEAQLASCEAEREQFELENRSLVNKLKVADVQPGVVEELTKEIERLKSESGQTAPQIDPEVHNAALERAEKLAGEIADLRTQQEMTQAMYNDLQSQYATEKEGRLNAEKSLEEARKIVDSVAEIQVQMSQVEDVIKKRDERIARLKSSNKKLKEQLQAMEESLRAAHRMADSGLFGLSEQPTAHPATISSTEMAAIEEEFECPDWFVSEPAPGEVSPLLQRDTEFGYQEPPKKNRKPENDAQLSLF